MTLPKSRESRWKAFTASRLYTGFQTPRQLNFRTTHNALMAVDLKGNVRTSYATERGAPFGMTYRHVVQIYGSPEAAADNQNFYYSREGLLLRRLRQTQ